MLSLTGFFKRYQIALFGVLMLLISWSIWLPQAAARLNLLESAIPLDSPLMLLTVWGPALAATVVALLTGGGAGLRALVRPLRRWRVGVGWYLLVLLLPAAIWLVSRAIVVLLGRSYELVSPLAAAGMPVAMLPALILLAIPNALGEELGWRGFALPKLQERFSALLASVIIGVVWGVWHLPSLIAQGQDVTGASAIMMIIGTIALAMLYTWMYNNTEGSLLIVWLFHAADAMTQYLLPRLPTLTDDLLIWMIAGIVLIIAGPRTMVRPRAVRASAV